MWIQHRRQSLALALLTARPRRRKHARDLREDTNRVHLVLIRDDVRIGVLILEEEGTEVGLAAGHHILDGAHDTWVAHDDGFVEAWEERASGNGEGEDLRVGFGYGLPGDLG